MEISKKFINRFFNSNEKQIHRYYFNQSLDI